MPTLKTAEEFALMAEAGRRLASVLREVEAAVRVGVTTRELDMLAERLIRKEGCEPAFLGYRPHGAKRGYPATLCTSLNEVVVHGVPNDTPLRNGDLLSLDIGLTYRGWYADMARTVPVGKVPTEVRRLVQVTEEALYRGIKAARPGATLGDIGHAIGSYVGKAGFSVVEGLTGHGIGRELHEDPYVLNSGHPGEGDRLEPGMVLALEPMVAVGKGAVRQAPDDSFVTKDGSLAAHFEHTVAITEGGPVVLTK